MGANYKKLFFALVILVNPILIYAKGNCSCPFNTKSNGAICGKGSAFCRPGGESPTCGTKSQKELQKLYSKWCS